jgi:hypothetical protein
MKKQSKEHVLKRCLRSVFRAFWQIDVKLAMVTLHQNHHRWLLQINENILTTGTLENRNFRMLTESRRLHHKKMISKNARLDTEDYKFGDIFCFEIMRWNRQTQWMPQSVTLKTNLLKPVGCRDMESIRRLDCRTSEITWIDRRSIQLSLNV